MSFSSVALRWLKRLIIPGVGWALSICMARSLGTPIDWWGVLACVAGVHGAYRFDSLADRLGFETLWRDPGLRIVLFDAGLVGCAALGSPRLIGPLVLLSLAGLFYIPLKRFIPKNLLTAGAWTGTVFALSLSGHTPTPESLMAAGALFFAVASNANLCDLPDVEDDRNNRVVGFGVIVGARATAQIAGAFGFVAAALAAGAGVFALCVPAIGYGILGVGFPDALAEHRSRRVWVDAALVGTGPLSLLMS
jgi:hypothetical protein